MLLIYSHKESNRLTYTCNLLFKDIAVCDFKITTNKEEFDSYEGPRMCYSYRRREGEMLFIKSVDLLFETGIKDLELKVQPWNQSVSMFQTDSTCDIGFDLLASSFFMVVRYEEYLPHMRDLYDRFDAQMSLADKEGFLDKAVVNRWANEVYSKLKAVYPSLKVESTQYKVVTTIDIDNAWAYLEKGIIRTIAGCLKSASQFNFRELGDRIKVLSGTKKDPYDTYEYQEEMYERFKLNLVYFFLLGDYGPNDKNIPYHSRKFQKLIKSLADIGIAGIHPSFGSNKGIQRLEKEVSRLEGIINRDVKHSRQHFLKLKLPDTYRNLIDCGVTNDYTMGYASKPGFRAGICTPFYFYDLDMEMETNLKVHPFMFMEGTFKYYMGKTDKEVLALVKPLVDEVKDLNGIFVSLWHNDSLNDLGIWKGWRAVFEDVHEYAINGN